MTRFQRGDVVLVDLGTTGKVRPCVVVSIPGADRERNISVVVPMTTQIRTTSEESESYHRRTR